MKTCSRCLVEKPLEDFYLVKRTGKPLAACKRCTCESSKVWREANPELFRQTIRKNWLRRQYGITVEEYDVLSASQNNCCAICGETPPGNLHVDHDHETGDVRGLLCRQCNTGLGLFREDVALLRKATDYLNPRSEL